MTPELDLQIEVDRLAIESFVRNEAKKSEIEQVENLPASPTHKSNQQKKKLR